MNQEDASDVQEVMDWTAEELLKIIPDALDSPEKYDRPCDQWTPEITLTMSPELSLQLTLMLCNLRDLAGREVDHDDDDLYKPSDRSAKRVALSIATNLLANCRFDAVTLQGEAVADLSQLVNILSELESDLALLDEGKVVPSLVPRKGRPVDKAWRSFREACCDAVTCFELCGDDNDAACGKVASLGQRRAAQLSKERTTYKFNNGMVKRWFEDSKRPKSSRRPDGPQIYARVAIFQMQHGVSYDAAVTAMKANLIHAAKTRLGGKEVFWPSGLHLAHAGLQMQNGVSRDDAFDLMKIMMKLNSDPRNYR